MKAAMADTHADTKTTAYATRTSELPVAAKMAASKAGNPTG
jgi:hypothetical protein